MRKLRLQLDSLKVDSFATSPRGERRGTVAAYVTNYGTCGTTCNDYTCVEETCMGGRQTCWDSCDTVCNSYFCL